MQIASVPRVSTSCASGNIARWVGFLQHAWLFWLLHSETFHTVHSRWELGSSAQALKLAYIRTKKINKYIVCVTRPWQSCCWEPLTGLCLGACVLHPRMPLAHHISMVALPAHGCSQTSDTKPSEPLLSPFFADSPADQTHLFPRYGYCDRTEFKSSFLRISNHWK